VWFGVINRSHYFDFVTNSFEVTDYHSNLPSSTDPISSLSELGMVTLLVGVYGLAFFVLLNCELFEKVLLAVFFNVIILAFIGVLCKLFGSEKMIFIYDPPLGTERYFFSTFTYKNHWGAYVCLVYGIIGYFVEKRRFDFSRSIVTGLVCAVMLLYYSVLLAGSRSCTLLVTFLMVFILYRLFTKLNFMPGGWRNVFALFVGLAACSFVFFVFYHNGEDFSEYVNNTRIYVDGYVNGDYGTRYRLTRDTAGMFWDRPIFGWGLGSFEFVFNFYNGGVYKGGDHPDSHHYVFAHNDILQYFAELGALGAVVLFVPFIVVAYIYMKYGRSETHLRWLAAVCFLIILYCFVEFPFRTPSVAILFTFIMSGLVRESLSVGKK
jgi:O-antigen ligase